MTGEELKKFRLSIPLSQSEFGKEIGFKNPQIQISQLEHGKRPITARTIKMIERWKENKKLTKELIKANNHAIPASAPQ